MALYSLVTAGLLLLSRVNAQPSSNSTQCRCMPGDACWPNSDAWSAFNATLDGKLIATTPYPSPCHDSVWGPYNETACADLQSTFFYPEPHTEWPSSIMAAYFTNDSCNPFSSPNSSCTMGNYVSYSVNATGPQDFQKVINFTTQNNIRLTVKNTGHDYNGKGAGAGAVGIWTHHMKSLELLNYTSVNYTGPAIKAGAGTQVIELYQFANDNGLAAVGGLCPTVGLAGGYTQGGGHGPLVTRYGMGADNVLEWEVVTGAGDFLVATPNNNSDLYWALSGGGGGTYGVVSSLTVKAHPGAKTSAANLTVNATGHEDQFWDVFQTFQEALPGIVDTGTYVQWDMGGDTFNIQPLFGFDVSVDEVRSMLNSTIAKLNETQIPYTYYVEQFDSFLDAYNAFSTPWNVSQSQIGGRLIPRTVVQQNSTSLNKAFRNITKNGGFISAVALNVSQGVPSPDTNSINPYWRTSLYDIVIGSSFSYTNWSANVEYQDQITYDMLPQLENLTPNGAAYLNEADFRQPDWQYVFYRDNYDTLSSIKQKYDPNDIFYGITGVGSENWYEDKDQGGRLCRVP